MPRRRPSEFDRQVGQRIRARRLELQLTLAEAAGRISFTVRKLQRYEAGEVVFKTGQLEQFAAALETSADRFTEGIPLLQQLPAQEFYATPDGIALASALTSVGNQASRLQLIGNLVPLILQFAARGGKA